METFTGYQWWSLMAAFIVIMVEQADCGQK